MVAIILLVSSIVGGLVTGEWGISYILLTVSLLLTWLDKRSIVRWYMAETDRLRLHIESLKNTGKKVLIIDEKSINVDRGFYDDTFYLDSDDKGVFWLMRNNTKWCIGTDSSIALSIYEKMNNINGYVHIMVTNRGLEYCEAGGDGWNVLLSIKGEENSDNEKRMKITFKRIRNYRF